MIYLYKECGDIEMAPVFLERLLPFLKVRYHGYILVPAPSHEEKILQRGFDHLPLMFKGLGKGVVHAILKKRNIKQTDLSMVERKQISTNLGGIKGVDFSGKKVLLIDDVYTTGSTISACIDIVKRMHPKKLKVLVLAKVPKNRKQGNEELTVG